MSQEEQQQEGQESPEQKKDKITKKYNAAMDVVRRVVGGSKNLLPKKSIGGDVTAEIVAELFQEEDEELRTAVKTGLKDLLKLHVKTQSEINAKRQELDKLEQQKKEEFTKAANSWMQKIDRASVMQAGYTDALTTAFTDDESPVDREVEAIAARGGNPQGSEGQA